MIIERVKWAYKLLRAKAFIVATDKTAIVYMPYVNPYALESMVIIASQRAAIGQIIENLEGVMQEHSDRIEQLQHDLKIKKGEAKHAKRNQSNK